MGKQTIKFEVITDNFHAGPANDFHEELGKSARKTESRLLVKFFNDSLVRSSEYTITKETGGVIYMLESLVNSKQGQFIDITFEPPVSPDYLEEFKRRIEGSTLRYTD